MPELNQLTELLACPRCDKTPLTLDDRQFSCSACKIQFPTLDGIPCLFADPETSLADWRSRLDRAVKQYRYEADGLATELSNNDLPESTRTRLTNYRDALADQAQRFTDFMQPLQIHTLEANHATYLAMRTRLPSDQGLNTYYNNIHRDWVWGDTENKASLDLVLKVVPNTIGKTLVLGAGGGRLAYDFHQAQQPELTVALDFNPFLLLLGKRMKEGGKLELYEFPVAPKSSESLLQTLKAPTPTNEKLQFVAADVLRAPFAAGSFDTIITPWLIDVIDEPLNIFAKRINQWLAPGGHWINFGSLAFAHPAKADCLSLEEVLEILPESGFGETKVVESTIPYMCSPNSRHGRREDVVTFSTQKTSNSRAPKRHTALPDWLIKGDDPVPALQSFQTQSMSTRIHAFIMGLIDGERSLKDMAKLMVEQKLLAPDEAVPNLRNFLIKMYEESQRG